MLLCAPAKADRQKEKKPHTKRPDINFTITVNAVAHVYGCRERRSQEARGCFGFDDAERCPNCRIIDTGYEFWGENGHCQGSAPSRECMVHWIATKAKQQWRTQDGKLMGYRFVKGGTLRYCGGYLRDDPGGAENGGG